MIRLIREGSQKYPWILKTIVVLIALTFVVGMGWWGFEAAQPNAVATVGPYEISLDGYRRAYNNAYRFYKDQLKQEDVDEASLKSVVLNSLIQAKMWNLAADKFDLSISEEEIRDAIVAQKEFQREDGTFDPQYYQRALKFIRMTPREYEEQRSIELMAEKARLLITESTALTPTELKEADELAARQVTEGKESDPSLIEQTRLQLLFQKKQRAIQAFQAAMLAKTEVELHEELL